MSLASGFRMIVCFALVFSIPLIGGASAPRPADWITPEQQLARKITAVTGPGAVAVTVENRSSLSKREVDIIQNGLRSALEGQGIRYVKVEQSAATVAISLSENLNSYVWVAEIRQGAGEQSVVMVSVARPEGIVAAHDSVPLTLRKTSLWSQQERILDVVVLEENSAPTHIAVLDGEKISLLKMQGGKWQPEQTLSITHAHPWPRDLRGRLLPARDHLLDAYLPGVFCRTTAGAPLTLTCRESDDPWPLVPPGAAATTFPSYGNTNTPSAAPLGAFFASTRNFFTGALTPGVGKFTTIPKFYSAAFLPREKYALWLFASVDGTIHMMDGVSDLGAKLGWGSDLAGLHTNCGSGWQVLATTAGGEGGDSVRAYEFPDREAVAVSAGLDTSGEVTAMWTESKGDSAVVVAHNRETGSYEAFRLAVACSQ